MPTSVYQGDRKFKPLSPWAYFGYSLLFSLPIIGIVLLIIFSINANNINRRNFARSYWCIYVLIAFWVALVLLTDSSAALINILLGTR